MPNPKTVPLAEYARMHDVSKPTAHQWKQEGVLVMWRGRVHVAKSDERMKARGLGRFREGAKPGTKPKAEPEPPIAPPANGNGNGGHAEGEGDVTGWTFTEARRQKEIELALKHRLAREMQEGQLVDRGDVRREQAGIATRVRESFMAWPGRVAAELAADLGVDPGELGAALEGQVRRFLTEQADDLAPGRS